MILYHVISTYQLLNAIVHKVKYCGDQECILIVSEWLVQKFPQYETLKAFFNDLMVLKADFFPIKGKYPDNNTELCETLLRENGYTVNSFSEINVWGCHYAFGAYLVYRQIPFIFWEDAAGILFSKDVLKGIDAGWSKEKSEWCDRMGLYDGNNPCIVKKYGNLSGIKSRNSLNNAEHFDVVEEYMDLPVDVKKEIRIFFTDVREIEVPQESVLLLTQHFANLKIMTQEEQILLYQLLTDYFFDDRNIVFKSHPDDNLDYSLFFSGSKTIRDKFPSEFLPEMFAVRPKTIATVSSTSIRNLSNYFEESFCLGSRFEKEFRCIHRYHAAICLAKKLDFPDIKIIGAMEKTVDYLIDSMKYSPKSKGEELYIIDNFEDVNGKCQSKIIDKLKLFSEDCAAVFICPERDLRLPDTDYQVLKKYIIPIFIRKKPIRKEAVFSDMNKEIICFYSKNKMKRRIAKRFYYRYELSNTGIEVATVKEWIKWRIFWRSWRQANRQGLVDTPKLSVV